MKRKEDVSRHFIGMSLMRCLSCTRFQSNRNITHCIINILWACERIQWKQRVLTYIICELTGRESTIQIRIAHGDYVGVNRANYVKIGQIVTVQTTIVPELGTLNTFVQLRIVLCVYRENLTVSNFVVIPCCPYFFIKGFCKSLLKWKYVA